MTTPEQIQQAISRVNDQTSFIQGLLYDTLQWPVDGGIEKVEDISFAWTAQELRAEGLDRHVVDGQVWQIQPLQEKQPWGVFLLEFNTVGAFIKGRGLTVPLRKVLRGLVSRRRKANLPIWDRENLLFICTHQYQYFRFGYFKAPKETKTAPLITFGWGPDTPARTACEFNLPALEWPQDPDNVEAWQEQWQRAFDKEKLTKDFFKTFANLYHQVVDDIAEVRELKGEAGKLAQLLLDRMLFLYFIQRKGWLDQKADYLYSRFLDCWNKDPDGHSYYSSVLYPLFFSLSNANLNPPEIGAVPFLNGGLFEETSKQSHAEEIAHARLHVKNSTFKLIFDNLLERFNFTVTEDTPLDVEVAIDPEMLGKIFESLILQLEKEPGKDLRKLTGSYYTPRPVVHFMCQEALKEYFVTQLAGDDNAKIQACQQVVEDLFKLPQAEQMDHEQIEILKGFFTPAEAKALRQAILDCRVCDPAVGSGAFLVGMLHEMVGAVARFDLFLHGRDILTQHNYYYDLKKQIIESCLYGVDIQEQAVRLCELRLWLSLIVDYQIDSSNPFTQAIREVPSLPNLSYRIMRGDSLLERIFGHVIQLDIMAKDARTKQVIESIQADKRAYFHEGATSEKRRLELKVLVKQADLAERLIQAKRSTLSYTANMFGDEGMTAKDRKAKAEHEQRLAKLAELKKKVAGAKSELERLNRQKGTVDRGDLDTLRRQYFHTGDAPTFMWCVDFADVFDKNGGFDVLIGNPPYGADIDNLVDVLRDVYPEVIKNYADIYKIFFERGLQLCTKAGVLTLITPNTFLAQPRYRDLRKVLLKYRIAKILNLGEDVFADGVVPVCITILRNAPHKNYYHFADSTIGSKFSGNLSEICFKSISLDNVFRFKDLSLLQRVIPKSDELYFAEVLEVKDAGIQYHRSGIGLKKKGGSDLYDRLFSRDPTQFKNSKPVWYGKLIDSYYITQATDEFFNLDYKDVLKSNESVSFTKMAFDEKDKILWRQTASHLRAVLDTRCRWFRNTIQCCWLKDEYRDKFDLQYILAIVNSSYMKYVYNLLVQEAGRVFPQVKITHVKKMPVKNVPLSKQQPFISLVNKILAITEDDDYLENPGKQTKVRDLEKQIDQMVYKLYGLTKEEKSIVEEHSKSN